MTTHELKIWPEYFAAVFDGKKTFEVRKNDRKYSVGDTIWLRMWDPKKEDYTGSKMLVEVTYVLDSGPHAIPGFVILSIKKGITWTLGQTPLCYGMSMFGGCGYIDHNELCMKCWLNPDMVLEGGRQ